LTVFIGSYVISRICVAYNIMNLQIGVTSTVRVPILVDICTILYIRPNVSYQ